MNLFWQDSDTRDGTVAQLSSLTRVELTSLLMSLGILPPTWGILKK